VVGALVRQRSSDGEAGDHGEQEASVKSAGGFHVVGFDNVKSDVVKGTWLSMGSSWKVEIEDLAGGLISLIEKAGRKGRHVPFICPQPTFPRHHVTHYMLLIRLRW